MEHTIGAEGRKERGTSARGAAKTLMEEFVCFDCIFLMTLFGSHTCKPDEIGIRDILGGILLG